MPYYDQNGQQVFYDPSGYGGPDATADLPQSFGQYPTLGDAIGQRKGIVGPSLKAGMYDVGGLLGAGVGAVGGAIGSDAVRDWGIGVSNDMAQQSAAAGRPDLEVMPWSNEWGQRGQTMADIPAWALYQVGKQVPQMGAAMVGGGVLGAGMEAAGFIAPGAEAAAALPTWMGGGGLRAGMAAEEANAARKAGADLAQRFAGTTVVGMPAAAGSMYQQEVERAQNAGEAPSQGAAMAALGLSPVYSALDAMTPTETVGMLKRGLSGNLGRRMATAALSEGAQEMVQEATQTGMEMAFRPDLSAADKAQNIIDAALVGGLVGGVFGSAGGIRRLKNIDPARVTDADMATTADEALGGQETPPDLPGDETEKLMPSLPMDIGKFKSALGYVTLENFARGNPPKLATLNQIADALPTIDATTLREGAVNKLRGLGLMSDVSREVRSPEDAVGVLQQKLDAAPDDASLKARFDTMTRLVEARKRLAEDTAAATAAAGETAPPAPLADGETIPAPPAYTPSTRAPVPSAPAGAAPLDTFMSMVPERLREPIAGLVGQIERVARANPERITPEAAADWVQRQGLPPEAGDALMAHLASLAPAAETVEAPVAEAASAPVTEGVTAAPSASAPVTEGVTESAPAAEAPSGFTNRTGNVVAKTGDKGTTERVAFQPKNNVVNYENRKTKFKAQLTPETVANPIEGVPEEVRSAAATFFAAKDKPSREAALAGLYDTWEGAAKARVAELGGAAPAAAAPVAAKAATPAKPAKAAASDKPVKMSAAERKAAQQQARVDAVGKAFISGRWHEISNYLDAGDKDYARIAKLTRMTPEEVEAVARWRNKPGEVRALLGYGVGAAEKAWPDAKTKEIAVRFLKSDGDLSPQEAIAEAKLALEGEDRYAERLQLVANLVKNATNQMKGRVTKSEETDDLAQQFNPMKKENQARFEKIGAAAQKALDRMVRSQKTTAQIFQLLTDPNEFRYASTGTHVSVAMINDYAQSIGETLPKSPIIEPRQLPKGDVEQLKKEREAVNQKLEEQQRRVRLHNALGERVSQSTKSTDQLLEERGMELSGKNLLPLRGKAGEREVDVKGRTAPITGLATLGELHKSLLGRSLEKSLRQLSPLVQRIANTPVYFVPHEDLQAAMSGAAGFFDRDKGHIVLSDEKVSSDEMAYRLMHEAVHAALHNTIDANPNAAKELMQIARALEKSGLVSKDDYALTDAHEFLSEAMSRPSLQRALEKLKMSDQQTGWRAFVSKVLEWLGWKGAPNALDAVMRVKERLEAVTAEPFDMLAALREEVGKDIDSILTDGANADRNRRLLAVMSRQVTAGADAVLNRLTGEIDKTMAKANTGPATVKYRGRALELYWSSFGHILQKWGKLFDKKVDGETKGNAVKDYGDHMTQRSAVTARLARLFGVAHDQLEEMSKKHKDLKERFSRLMAITTELGIDPDKTWTQVKDSKRIADLVKGDEEEKRYKQLKERYDEAVAIKRWMGQNASVGNGRSIYDVYRDLNAMLLNANQAVMLYNLVSSDPYFTNTAAGAPSLKRVRLDPVEEFLKNTKLHEDPNEAAKYWSGEIENRVADVQNYLAYMITQKERMSDADQKNFERSQAPLASMIHDLISQLSTMREAPYFHLGRHGEFIARFDMKPTENTAGMSKEKQVMDTETVKKVSDRLKQLYPNAVIAPESNSPRVMIRFESKDERDKVIEALKQMQREGLIDKVQADMHTNLTNSDVQQPAWLERFIESIQSDSALNADQKRNMVSIARKTWLDQLSDTAVARVMAQRQFIPGYHTDMLRNFAFRAEVGINSLANLSIAAKLRTAFTDMDTMWDAESYRDAGKADLMKQVIGELKQRDADRPATTGKDWIDTWRAVNQAFFLGMSPAYTMVNMTQLGVMLLPELAKRHGFVNSAKMISAVTGAAFKIIRETYAEGRKVSFSRALDAVITGDVLARALPGRENAEMRDFLTRMVNSGNIDLGSPMRELGRTAEGVQNSKTDQALRFASALGYYSETLSRLIAVMAAHKLEQEAGTTDATKIDRYAGGVLNDAMLNYSNWYTARATGKAGVLGKFTPIPASFQQYTLQVLQKLYREAGDAFMAEQQEGESAEDHKARVAGARRFLRGHSAALAVLAGSLGLPFTTVALYAADKLRDAFDDDDEPHDTKTDYRNFLADVFGKEVGEVMAHGLPRAFGFDIGGRVGEQDMLFLSRFIADRRKMEDATKDLVFRTVGSPVSMMAGMVNGGWEMSQGNYLQGLQMMVPNSIKGGIKAYKMAEGGYQDEKGVPLPMQADPSDIMWQALGLNPAEKAEYTEANMARSTRKTLVQREASQLRNALVEETQSGGVSPETMRRAQKFDQANQQYAVLPTLGSTIARRQKDAALARSLGSPLGVRPEEIDERNRLGFANLRR